MKNTSRTTGFTLLELLVVMVIIGLAAGVGVANFRDFGKRQDIDNYSRTLIGDLRSTHADASAGRRITGCVGSFQGYAIDFSVVSSGVGSKANSYTVKAICSTTPMELKTVTVPSTLSIIINRPPSGTTVRLLFKPLELGTDVAAGNDLTLTVKSADTSITQTKVVTVTSSGEIQ